MTKRKRINKLGKKDKKQVNDIQNLEQFDSLIKIFGVIVLIFFVFYAITVLIINNREKEKDEQDVIAFIQYDEILAGETFNKKDDSYYVLFYDFTADDAMVYDYAVDEYKMEFDSIPLYTVDLSKGFNAPYTGEKSNKGVTTVTELSVSGPTLIKIEKGKNVLYKEGIAEIGTILE